MASPNGVMTISIKVRISLWDALKLRIAGSGARQAIEKSREDNKAEEDKKRRVEEELENINKAGVAPEKIQEETGTMRLNKRTGKVEISSVAYSSEVGISNIWVDYDKDLLANTFGRCPNCYASHSLMTFRKGIISEEEKGT